MAKTNEGVFQFDLVKELARRELTVNQLEAASGLSRRSIQRALVGTTRIRASTLSRIVETINRIQKEHFEPLSPADFAVEDLRNVVKFDSNQQIEGLTPLDFANLSLTNPDRWRNSQSAEDFRLLTTKNAYIFAPEITSIAQHDDFESRSREFSDALNKRFEETSKFSVPAIDNTTITETDYTRRYLTGPEARLGARDIEETNDSLQDLVDLGYIVDPIVESVGTVSIAVLGFVPMSFTKRTENGDVVHRKISALFWEYEKLSEEEQDTIKIYIRIEKLVDLIKKSVALAHTKLNDQVESSKTN